MYTYKILIEVEILNPRHNNVIEKQKMVEVKVEHREAAFLQAYFRVANGYRIDSIISMKIRHWEEIVSEG